MQPGVLYRDRNLAGDDGQEALVGRREPVRRVSANGQRAEQLFAGRHRHAQRADRHQPQIGAFRHQRPQIFENHRRLRGNDLVARAQPLEADLLPRVRQARIADKGVPFVRTGQIVAEADGSADALERAHHVLQRSGEDVAQLERARNPSAISLMVCSPRPPLVIELTRGVRSRGSPWRTDVEIEWLGTNAIAPVGTGAPRSVVVDEITTISM